MQDFNNLEFIKFEENHFSEELATGSNKNILNLEINDVIKNEFTDIGIYSYLILVAMALRKLFSPAIEHKQFCSLTIKNLIKYIGKCKSLEHSMLLLMEGEVELDNFENFVDCINNEEVVQKLGKWIIIQNLLILSINTGIYDARSQALLKQLSIYLGIENQVLRSLEENIEKVFDETTYQQSILETKEKEKLDRNRNIQKVALISLATITGGALIGLTAGLATPLVAASAGAIIGSTGIAAFLGTVGGAALMGSIFGIAGAGLTGYKMKRRVGGVEEFCFEQMSGGRSLLITIAVTGWINDEFPDFTKVWRGLNNSKEQYCLCYESKYLREIGRSLNYMTGLGVGKSVISGLALTMLMPSMLMSSASIIDNPWNVATNRSWKAGQQLADVLISRKQGKRPVTLIGFSFGARLIFSCLFEMAKRSGGIGIVEDVIMLGAPVTCDVNEWSVLNKVVSGRIVNGYSINDWVLKYIYRTASVQISVAGLGPIMWDNRIMQNLDLSHIVEGHMDYLSKMDEILASIGIDVVEHVIADGVGKLALFSNSSEPNTNINTKNVNKLNNTSIDNSFNKIENNNSVHSTKFKTDADYLINNPKNEIIVQAFDFIDTTNDFTLIENKFDFKPDINDKLEKPTISNDINSEIYSNIDNNFKYRGLESKSTEPNISIVENNLDTFAAPLTINAKTNMKGESNISKTNDSELTLDSFSFSLESNKRFISSYINSDIDSNNNQN